MVVQGVGAATTVACTQLAQEVVLRSEQYRSHGSDGVNMLGTLSQAGVLKTASENGKKLTGRPAIPRVKGVPPQPAQRFLRGNDEEIG